MRPCSAIVAALLVALALPAAAREPVTLFAAASTARALGEAAALFREQEGLALREVHASSGTLARQIGHGAPAALFVSANSEWMDYLEARGRLVEGSRVALFGNRLVLAAPADGAWRLEIAPGLPLAERLGDRPLALADPAHAPLGRYAREALQTLGVWEALSPRAARAQDATAALALVARGEAGAGIVYRTDAMGSERVRIVDVFPSSAHSPIRYELALVAGRATPEARRLHAFLRSEAARAVYARHGFLVE